VDGLLPAPIAIVGAGRKPFDADSYRRFAREGVDKFSRRKVDEDAWRSFAEALFFVAMDVERADAFAQLGARLDTIEHERGLPGNRVYYLAVPPSMFAPVVHQLAHARFVVPPGSRRKPEPNAPWSRVIVEKPIGHDLASAIAINDAIAEVFAEHQIFRIDHYLGKETVQNLMVLRFANSVFEPHFNHRHVDHVQITVAEEEGVGTRAGYYEQAGALRDMVQNHLLQLLTLVATEPPHSLDADAVRDEKLQVLRSLRPIEGDDIAQAVVRGQYGAGFHVGAPVPGYQEEAGVGKGSRIETFVAVRAFIDNWRWAGVPFFLRTGKRLPKRASEISIHLKEVPPILFNRDPAAPLDPNVLTFRIQPDEGFALRIESKVPGPRVRVYPVHMDFRYGSTFGARSPEAYERLLLDVMVGDATLFMRRDSVEASWRWIEPILQRWRDEGSRAALPTYAAGDWGPAEADRLIAASGRRWRSL
jgi:glucose-6-phosphate 1-dehydrogenase